MNHLLWPFALEHAVTLWNHMPRNRSGLAPIELFTKTKSPHHDVILNSRVWGCPTFVLDPKLQDGNTLPKWSKKSRLGMNLGLSMKHSTTVARILNLSSGNVSPQFHLLFDEWFHFRP